MKNSIKERYRKHLERARESVRLSALRMGEHNNEQNKAWYAHTTNQLNMLQRRYKQL